MRLFLFVSQTRPGLHAYTGEKTGSRLPEKVGPWRLLYGSASGGTLPHGIARRGIEQAIIAEGYQMWRLKP